MKANRYFWLAASAAIFAMGCSDDSSSSSGKRVVEACSTGLEKCGEVCVDFKTDAQHCGACGNACKTGESCVEGSCEASETPVVCGDGQNACGTECVDFKTDAMHCGSCEKSCNEDETCTEGECQAKPLECVEGKEACGEACYDLATDNDHCGNCDTACKSDEICQAGTCEKICKADQQYCNESCKDVLTDNDNCGECGNTCTVGTECKAGSCEDICDDDKAYCSDTCVDLTTDANHCGECGNACVESQKCADSHCVDKCESGETYVEGNCYNLDTDNEHCGADLVKCGEGTKCADGSCVSVCASGETYCAGECVDLNSDKANCGACGSACGDGLVCNKGECRKDCGDLLVCDELCTDGAISTAFCGAKGECSSTDVSSADYRGTICQGDEICSDGTCRCAKDGDALCLSQDGSLFCTSGANDAKHCGCDASNVGMNCTSLSHASASSCEAGSCKLACEAGYADCDGNIENGCETSLNDINSCGACGNKCDTTNTVSAACVAGKCELNCFENHDTCGGTQCVALYSDDNCGACGNKCDAQSSCADNVCLQDKCDADGYTAYKTPDGKEVRAYCIGSVEELANMRDAINNNSVYPSDNKENAYLLTANIQIFDESWDSIGNVDHPFTGKFYGNTRTISSSRLFACKSNYCGLFGRVVGASESERAVIDGVNAELIFNAKNNYVGVLVGATNYADVSRCHVTGTISAVSNAGGLIGSVVKSKVSDSSANVSVTTTKDMAGGVFGYTENSEISNTQGYGNVVGNNSVGGHTGYAKSSTISQSSATGSAVSTGTTGAYGFGGFVGTSEGSTFKLNSAAGYAEGYYSVGGFLGRGIRTTTITQCGAFGNVKTSSAGGVGGVAGVDHGDKLVLESTFSVGNVTNGYGGTIYGSNDSGTTTLTNSYGTGVVNSGSSGYICGGYTGSGSITASGSYGWVNSASKAMGTSQGLTSASTYGTFDYVDGVPMVGDSSLYKVLNADFDVWEEKECTLSSGPGTADAPVKVKLPVLKGIETFGVCKSFE